MKLRRIMKKTTTASAILSLILLSLSCPAQGTPQQVSRNDEWVLNTSYGVRVWIAFNDIIHSGVGDRRQIILFIEAEQLLVGGP